MDEPYSNMIDVLTERGDLNTDTQEKCHVMIQGEGDPGEKP